MTSLNYDDTSLEFFSLQRNYAEWTKQKKKQQPGDNNISRKGYNIISSSTNNPHKRQTTSIKGGYSTGQFETKSITKQEQHLNSQKGFKERHQRLFIFSLDMYEKLLQHRETIERRIAVINKHHRQHGNDGDGREDVSIDDVSIGGEGSESGNSDGGSTEMHRRGGGASLYFDNTRCSVLIDADEEEAVSRAKRELCQLFPTITLSPTTETEIVPSSSGDKNTDELGLSDLLPSLLLESDMKNELLSTTDEGRKLNTIELNNGVEEYLGQVTGSARPLTYAASWDVSTQSTTNIGTNADARRCHSSSAVMPSCLAHHQHLSLRNQQQSISSFSQPHQHRSLHNQQHLTDPVNLLLQSPLPPELCISSSLSSNVSSSATPRYSNVQNKPEEDIKDSIQFESQQVTANFNWNLILHYLNSKMYGFCEFFRFKIIFNLFYFSHYFGPSTLN